MPARERPAIFPALLRGLRLRCPRCGGAPLFVRGYRLRERCERCGLGFAPYAEDTWAMIYFSTAGLTGLVVIGLWSAIVVSLPFRKGAAIALNWLISTRGGVEPGRVPSDPPDC